MKTQNRTIWTNFPYCLSPLITFFCSSFIYLFLSNRPKNKFYLIKSIFNNIGQFLDNLDLFSLAVMIWRGRNFIEGLKKNVCF